ncbi:MAG: HAD family hydrolase [Deltaproteobacteria bacterium]|nr:HAD family hydrolase [Deltaproteobacteria bacterium]
MKIKSQNTIKGVLFDFDGTLTYPGALDFPAIKREMNCPEDKPILEYLETQPPARRARLMKILEFREEEAAERSFSNRGAEKCLSALKRKGVLLGIITRNSLKSVSRMLKKFDGITIGDFATVITRENSLPKPHPEGVYAAARQMGLLTSELMVVGDFRFDVLAGNRAGALTVLLTNKGKSSMAPGDPEPDHTVDCLEDVLNIIYPH